VTVKQKQANCAEKSRSKGRQALRINPRAMLAAEIEPCPQFARSGVNASDVPQLMSVAAKGESATVFAGKPL
jgi:diaminopimelate decarboxylase